MSRSGRRATRLGVTASALVGLAVLAPAPAPAMALEALVPTPGEPCGEGAGEIRCAVDEAIEQIATGDGAGAAGTIHEAGYSEQPAILADIIFRAGVASVDRGNSTTFADSVAAMFTEGGSSLVTATDSFRRAGTLAAANGLTPEQARVGAEAIAKTYAAYGI